MELIWLTSRPDANQQRIVELNVAGLWPEGDPTGLEAGANRCATG